MNKAIQFFGKRECFIVLLIPLAIAVGLRFSGIAWGAPERVDLHPDEIKYVIGHAQSVSWSHPDPGFLNYPSFLCYSTALVNGFLKMIGLVHADWQIYLVGRSISAVYGVLTCAVVFLLAGELGFSLLGAFLASLFMAILPLHVWESHVAVTDVMMTFWIMVTLYASVRLIRHTRPRDFIFAGLALGLAVGSKYTAALAGIAPVTALIVGKKPMGESVRGLCLLGLAALAACFVVTPFSFLHFKELLAAMSYENAHVHGHHSGFSVPAVGPQYRRYVYELAAAWPFSLGMALYLGAAAGAIWAMARWKKEYAVVAAFAVLFFGVVGGWTFKPLRYTLPLQVIGVLPAALWMADWMMSSDRFKRGFGVAVAIFVAVYTFAFTCSTTRRFANDTRMQATEWLKDNYQPDQVLLLCGDMHYMATLPGFSNIVTRKESFLGGVDRNDTIDLIELSSLHYLRWYRHGNAAYMHVYDQFRAGRCKYELVKRFEADYLHKDFYRLLDPMFECYFISPTLEFYSRKPDAG